MAALRSAVIASEMLTSQDVYSLSLVCKAASVIVRETVRAIGGNAKVLTFLPRFPSTTSLTVGFKQHCTGLVSLSKRIDSPPPKRKGAPIVFFVPPQVITDGVDLSRLRTLSVCIDTAIDFSSTSQRKPARKRRGERGSSSSSSSTTANIEPVVADPLASIIMPGLHKARISTLTLGSCGDNALGLPTFTSLLSHPSVLPSLVSLTLYGAHFTNDLVAAFWRAVESATSSNTIAFPCLRSLSIGGFASVSSQPPTSAAIVTLLRGVAARKRLPCLENLALLAASAISTVDSAP